MREQSSNSAWRAAFQSLRNLNVLAEWKLSSGVSFFMRIPDSSRLEPNGVEGTTVAYKEISELVVRPEQPLGNLHASNDVAAALKCIHGISELEALKDADGALRIRCSSNPLA